MSRRFLTLWLFLAMIASAHAQATFPAFTSTDRIVVVAPHPDDEVLGAGGIIQQALAAGAEVRLIYLTNGDHNQIAFKLYNHSLFLRARDYLAFGERRRMEAIAAADLIGLPADHLTFLGYPDWGTLTMWRDYWDSDEPFRSDATRVNAVPYKEDFGYQHPYTPEAVVADFVSLFRQFHPTKIFVTHPCDTNPDHRAAANFVRLATLDLEAEGLHSVLYYYVIHFGNWPLPYHYHPDAGLEPPQALLDEGDWMSVSLTTDQTEKKYAAILRNRTQTTTREYYLVAFARTNEIFATIDPPRVPRLQPDLPLDWRKAVRNKAMVITTGDPNEPIPLPGESLIEPAGKSGERTPASPAEESIALAQTEFLRQGDDVIAQVELRNRLGKRTNVHLLLFGYKRDEKFDMLPKIKIDITPFGEIHVYDGRKRLAKHGVTLTSVANRFFVRIPLQLLGGNTLEYLFTQTRANLGEITPDDTAWRLFELAESRNEPVSRLSVPNHRFKHPL